MHESATPRILPTAATDTIGSIEGHIGTVIKGQQTTIRLSLCALLTGGHILLEDFPGTGKTTLAKAVSRTIDAEYQRIQFTPDLLPTDIIGVSIYDQAARSFEFHKGPIFSNILLADEINRASPRTQSALLEAMAENQISHDGERHALGELFFVIATENPIELHGTYPLPEAQLDRFAMRLRLGYLDAAKEVEMLDERVHGDPLDALTPRADIDGILALRRTASAITISAELKRYIVDIVAATRSMPGVRLGASPRASLSLMKLAQALALSEGHDFVTPDHVQTLAAPVIAHRLLLTDEARFAGTVAEQIMAEVLERLPVPR
jgi:MoxR-like ATPase